MRYALLVLLALLSAAFTYGTDALVRRTIKRYRKSRQKGWSEEDIKELRARLVTKFEGMEAVGDAIPPGTFVKSAAADPRGGGPG